MNSGKSVRMNSILNPADGRTVVAALDHGCMAGPLEGIEEPVRVFNEGVDGGADACVRRRLPLLVEATPATGDGNKNIAGAVRLAARVYLEK